MAHGAHRLEPVLEQTARRDGYARRRPETTVLYQTIAAHWPAFIERMEEHGGLPKFVRDEFEAYLRCGRLEMGCLELECRTCGHSQLVAFSCKRRGFCPACLGRRMSDTAVHLIAEVLPEVPIRHWVCTFPWGVRAVLGYDKELCQAAVSALTLELSRSLKGRAKKLLGLGRVDQALTGSVAVVQRTDSALRLNVHVHLLALDGVFVEDEQGELDFHALDAPTSAEVVDIARCTARRLHRAFKKKGRTSPWDEEHAVVDSAEADPLRLEQPGLFACYQAAAAGLAVSGERAGQALLRLVAGGQAEPHSSDRAASSEPVAEALGINLYAKQRIDGRDRQQLERLGRYVMRPPLSQERLERRPDGRLELTLKNVWKDRTRALLLEPEDLLVRLCACVPPPWFHMIRYFGVLASHSRYRARVVPSVVEPSRFLPEAARGDQLQLGFGSSNSRASASAPRHGRSRWGWLIARVFRADVDTCCRCGGPMRWARVATEPDAIARLLANHGLASEPSPERRVRVASGQLPLPFA